MAEETGSRQLHTPTGTSPFLPRKGGNNGVETHLLHQPGPRITDYWQRNRVAHLRLSGLTRPEPAGEDCGRTSPYPPLFADYVRLDSGNSRFMPGGPRPRAR